MTGQALHGQTAVITGATGAIAESCARALARDGARLVLMGRRSDALELVADRIRTQISGAEVVTVVGDCRDEEAVRQALVSAHAIAGRLDIAFATVGGGHFCPLLQLDGQEFRDQFDNNVLSAFYVLRHAVPLMRPGGSIICLSSGAAAMTFRYLSSYTVAKAALEGLVRSAADELGPLGIRINAIRPGLTRSNSTDSIFEDEAAQQSYLPEYPLGRLGEAEDMAGAVRFLAGPESAWVTGQCIAVDGGNMLRRSPDLTPIVESHFGEQPRAAAQQMKGNPA
jgi:NAD(P)-dependent dehydrogenase (short-subunit alcohol dehydrogenase family)